MKISFEKIEVIFKSTFELNEFKVSPSSRFEEVPGWDSLGHVRLIFCFRR